MKQYLTNGALALVLGGFLTSCSHEEFDISTYVADKVKTYEQVFIKEFGTIDPEQDWGFGTTATEAQARNGLTRAVFTDKWTNDHSCNWESKLSFTKPSNAVDVTQANFDKSGSVYYVPESFSGALSLGWLGLNAGAELYIYGNVTAINEVNYNGTITFYIGSTATVTNFGPSSGGRHTVINAGNLTVCGYANIGDLYNGGALVLEREHNPYYENIGGSADIPNAMNIYSNGSATIEMPDGGDLKAVCDIHGKLKVGDGKDLKIQNSTKKYICGIESTAKVENVDGPLQTSYVKANLFTFDGNPIYLLPGGYVDVTTLQVPNSNCHVYGHTGSVALIKATNVEFGNKNDFTHTFSDNIYFKISGSVKVDNCYAMGQSHSFSNVADYLADTTHADEFGLAANRINAGNASGAPACGEAWTVGTGTTTPPAEEDGDDETEEPDGLDGYNFFARVFAEDLSANTGSDFDFNDVVFDVYTKGNDGKIVLLAAGGTLSLTVNGEEVHEAFGVGTGTMVNTFNVNEKKPVVLKKSVKISGMDDVKKIEIKVEKEIGDISAWLELAADKGKPAAKFAVKEQIEWCTERVGIDSKYTNFKSWVEKKEPAEWWK